jgi:hypothetical protein
MGVERKDDQQSVTNLTRHGIQCLVVFTRLMEMDTKAMQQQRRRLSFVSFSHHARFYCFILHARWSRCGCTPCIVSNSLSCFAVFAGFNITLGKQILFPPDFLNISSSSIPAEVGPSNVLRPFADIRGA